MTDEWSEQQLLLYLGHEEFAKVPPVQQAAVAAWVQSQRLNYEQVQCMLMHPSVEPTLYIVTFKTNEVGERYMDPESPGAPPFSDQKKPIWIANDAHAFIDIPIWAAEVFGLYGSQVEIEGGVNLVLVLKFVRTHK